MRYVQEEEEESGGRVPVGEVEHHAENRVDARGFSGSCSKDQIFEGDRSIVLDQRSSQYGKSSNSFEYDTIPSEKVDLSFRCRLSYLLFPNEIRTTLLSESTFQLGLRLTGCVSIGSHGVFFQYTRTKMV